MNKDVEIKDRANNVEYIRMVLNICQVSVDYKHADLINRVTEELHKRKGKFSIDEGVQLFYKWQKDWEEYFEKKAQTNSDKAADLKETDC
jgi:hypothetical protein